MAAEVVVEDGEGPRSEVEVSLADDTKSSTTWWSWLWKGRRVTDHSRPWGWGR